MAITRWIIDCSKKTTTALAASLLGELMTMVAQSSAMVPAVGSSEYRQPARLSREDKILSIVVTQGKVLCYNDNIHKDIGDRDENHPAPVSPIH